LCIYVFWIWLTELDASDLDRYVYMMVRRVWSNKQFVIIVSIFIIFLFNLPSLSAAFTQTERYNFQRSIADFRSRLNPSYIKVQRKKTKHIIVHTSELSLKTTLRVVSKGKHLRNGRRTNGGHAHYVIARNGRTYRILDKKYVADHAGRSMWNGETDISKLSIGIELVGHHYAPISEKQYRSAGTLIEILQDVYDLSDRSVLTHSQVAYGLPNRWFKEVHRGRKRCAKNFIRTKAGLGATWPYDPDVRAGRLMADAQLSDMFYGQHKVDHQPDEANVISKRNTAWAIAGEDYDSTTTVYKFPNGRQYTGDQIADEVGWNRVPAKTVVLLNHESSFELIKDNGIIKTISNGITAWSLAGKSYNRETTIYFLPSGQIKPGSMINDWNDLPAKTRLIIGYQGPYKLNKDRTAFRIAGLKYKDQKTIYYLPSKKLLSGNKIRDFSQLPIGTYIFLPATL
jgi:N-acetyl-anhydromuramyl-L-alanine amidase AmpD